MVLTRSSAAQWSTRPRSAAHCAFYASFVSKSLGSHGREIDETQRRNTAEKKPYMRRRTQVRTTGNKCDLFGHH